MKQLFLFCIIFFASFSSICAIIGIDVPQNVCLNMTEKDWKCLARHDLPFAVLEVFHGGAGENVNIERCVKQATKAGFQVNDLSALICPGCQGNDHIREKIAAVINDLRRQKIEFKTFWLQINYCMGCWDNTRTANSAFISEAVRTLEDLNVNVGIFTSKYDWTSVVGNFSLSELPLWYHHFDGEPNYSDISLYDFAGWRYPSMKQFYNLAPADCTPMVYMDYYQRAPN